MTYHAEPKGNLPMRAGGLIVRLKQRTICFVFIFSILSFPAISTTTINSNTSTANCNDTVLDGVTDGSVDLTAGWQANNIGITWYTQGNTTASGGSSQCTYDGTITLPTQPTRTGYVFGGWRVRVSNPLLSLDADIAASETSSEQVGETCFVGGYSGGNGNWAAEFSYGSMTGQTICSTTSGSPLQTGTPDESSCGLHCWAKVNTYTPSAGSVQNVSSSSPWVYVGYFVQCDECVGFVETLLTWSEEPGYAYFDPDEDPYTEGEAEYNPVDFRTILFGQ